MEWLTNSTLSVVVVGASGDLAKKMTYPSLVNLFDDNLLPKNTKIFGYARSEMSNEELREKLRPGLCKKDHSESVVDDFLERCVYSNGESYSDTDAFDKLCGAMEDFEKESSDMDHFNRLFYFAIPPSSFGETAKAIKKSCVQDKEKGFTRLILEKPFGRDLESFEELDATLSESFSEEHIFRIDHYLGKELVQNLSVLRFSNNWFEPIWNKEHVQCVIITMKEDFGTDGRGGYYDKYGVIRDVIQNHLLQTLALLAMESPKKINGEGSGNAIRDAKVEVLKAMRPIELDDVVLGQYEGYAEDDSIENKDTNTATFAVIRAYIDTPRWSGVPFILKSGKALNEKKAEMRIQFKDAPAANFLFEGHDCPRNELVMRMQPHEAIYIKTNVKSPGFIAKPIQSELEVNYDTRFFAHFKETNPDAYTRLILDVLQNKHGSFLRDDELRRAWEIFTPVLHKIEEDNVRPIIYAQGSRGPKEADEFIQERAGYVRNEDYVFYEGNVARKTEGTNVAPVSAKDVDLDFPDDELCDIGLFGLAVMGQNFALNMAEHGFKVCVCNRTLAKVDTTVARAKEEGDLPVVGAKSPQELIARLKKPRKIVILVQAGQPVDDTISTLARYMESGDLIIDGGNEWYSNSVRRGKFLEPKGIHFIGMGISGGEEGARKGPSLMPGGKKEAYELIEPIMKKSAAQTEKGPCVGYLGPIGAGNYVKMVHNGIEYGMMQLIAEVYDVLKHIVGFSNEELADLLDEWNTTELDSYLIEITAKILRKKDEESGEGYVIDHILDKTGSKGTGKWTVLEGAEQGIPIPTIAAALDSRMLSGLKEERKSASEIYGEPSVGSIDKESVVNDLRLALYASNVCAYAQGLSLIKAASDEKKWKIDISECPRLWMGGCIIRAELLSKIQNAMAGDPNLKNLLLDKGFSAEVKDRVDAWRRTVSLCVSSGIACPALCSSLSYFDAYRRARLPANLSQAQRDFFGGHTYERIDKEGRFHTAWTDAHKDIGDASKRIAGESK